MLCLHMAIFCGLFYYIGSKNEVTPNLFKLDMVVTKYTFGGGKLSIG